MKSTSSVIYRIVQISLFTFIHLNLSSQEDDFSVNIAASNLGAPRIIPSEPDITLDPGTSRTLECQSKHPVTWRVFQGFGGRHRIRSVPTADSSEPYGSILELVDVDYSYVGEFDCIHNDSIDNENYEELRTSFKASRIYVFVNDPENLMVRSTEWHIVGKQYSDLIIPCKPTSKDVKLKLIKDGDEEINGRFDPTIGFTIRVNKVHDEGYYTCRDSNNSEKSFEVSINLVSDSINKPTIMSITDHYVTQGEKLELECSVDVRAGVKFTFNWTLPPKSSADREGRLNISLRNLESHPDDMSQNTGRSTLQIVKVDRESDAGYYKCKVQDNSGNEDSESFLISVLGQGDSTIDLWEPNYSYELNISTKDKSDATWTVNYMGHPKPELAWYDNYNNQIISNLNDQIKKYDVTFGARHTTLKIHQVELGDTGNYTLRAWNGRISKERSFELVVRDKPSVKADSVQVRPGEQARLICECAGYPASKVTWSFTPCDISPVWPTCHPEKNREFSDSVEGDGDFNENDIITVTTLTRQAQRFELTFVPSQPGIATCKAQNSEGVASIEAQVIISDLNETMQIWGIDEQIPTAAGDAVNLTCGASVYAYAAELHWYLNNEPVESREDLQVVAYHTDYSYRKNLIWTSVDITDTGTYVCRANFISSENYTTKDLLLRVHEPRYPEIDTTTLNVSEISQKIGESVRMQCVFFGMPVPVIQWYKDDILLEPKLNDTRITLKDEKTVLFIRFVTIEDAGVYRCEARNRLGRASQASTLRIKNMPTVSKSIIIAIVILILVLILFTIYLCIRIRRARKMLKELKAAGLANFEEGSPDSINPELALDEQAELLPYDKKYEFARDKLKMGKQLGAGAFGVVVKAVAQNIVPYENETTVAVKMVKQTADNEVMRALISELKIMVHLGQHLNVVNLLGAVTKNIAKREVMVIVEYCRFGNVQNFLVKHRNYFIDQILRDRDIIDPNITTKEQRWSNDSGYEYYNSKKRGDSMRPNSGQSRAFPRESEPRDYFPGGMDSANTEAQLISRTYTPGPGGEDNPVLSNNSVQPAWRSNYKMDYKGPVRDVTTTDLLCWAFQVARGMQYLASRKVLHGDLAARNILLCDNNVVKICDFGLARSMYKSDNYKKKGETPLPFKWLAIESIGDQIFSTYSDVWSFGIVLWELFSLGKVPYPGMDADQGLYFKLKNGYRMEKPEYSTQDIYDIMLQCWSLNPESRPLFSDLEKHLGRLLEKGVAEHYIDLNEPYLQMNVDQFATRPVDYLAAMAAPEGIAPKPPIPTYVNGHLIQMANAPNIPDYLMMSPTNSQNINSPLSDREEPAGHFQFPTLDSASNSSPSSRNRLRKPGVPEEIPMLKRSNQSISTTDSESDVSPVAPTSQRPFGDVGVKPMPRDLKKTENYVNVPSTIINVNNQYDDKNAVSNPGYVMVGNVNESKT